MAVRTQTMWGWRQRAMLRAGQIRPSRAIAGFGVALGLAIAAFTVFTLWYLREEVLEDAERQVAKLDLVLSEQTLRAAEAIDVVLQATVEKLRATDILAANEGRWADPEAFHEMLKAQFAGMPQIRALFVTDYAGKMIHDSRQVPAPALDLTDRRYFQVHRDNAAAGLFIGEPLRGRIDGLVGFQISRRYEDSFGAFAGVVAATIEPQYFLDLYRSIDLGEGSAIALIRRDGTVLVRYPYESQMIGSSLAGSTGFTQVLARGAQSGSFRQRDGNRPNRISAVRALDPLPLVVYVSMSEKAALAGWRQQAAILGGGALAGMVTFLAMLALLAHQFSRQERLTAQLAASEQRFRDVAESASDWIWEMGPDMRFTYFSDRLVTSTGIRPGDVLGRSRMDVTSNQLSDPAWRTHLEVLNSRQPFRGFVYAHRRHDGVIRWLKVSGMPVYSSEGGSEGRFEGYRGTGTDITSEYEAEERAHLAQARLQDAVEFLPDGFVLYDHEDRLVLCNERYRKLHAQTIAALQPGMKFEAIIRAAHASGEQDAGGDVEAAIQHRLERHRNPGQPFELISQSRVIRVAERRTGDGGTVGLHIDITDLKRREAALLEAKQQADAANRAKSDFLANMSHELRTPLNAIIGFAEAIERKLFGEHSPRYHDYAGDIRKSGEHLLAVIADILDMSKIESGKYEFHEEVINLPETIASCVLMVRHQAEERGIELTMPAMLSELWLYADRRAVTQVALNLLSNAVKFTDRGGKVTVELVEQGIGAGLTVALVVSDTGSGIEPEALPRLFEPFSRGPASTAHKTEGTGLGLAISRKLMERHGGTIRIRSALGKGTTATASFPAARISPRPALAAS